MKTPNHYHALASLSWRCAIALSAIAISALAFADSSKDGAPAPQTKHAAQNAPRKVRYMEMGGSAIPQPCDRLTGAVPTTVAPMQIIGEVPVQCTSK